MRVGQNIYTGEPRSAVHLGVSMQVHPVAPTAGEQIRELRSCVDTLEMWPHGLAIIAATVCQSLDGGFSGSGMEKGEI